MCLISCVYFIGSSGYFLTDVWNSSFLKNWSEVLGGLKGLGGSEESCPPGFVQIQLDGAEK